MVALGWHVIVTIRFHYYEVWKFLSPLDRRSNNQLHGKIFVRWDLTYTKYIAKGVILFAQCFFINFLFMFFHNWAVFARLLS